MSSRNIKACAALVVVVFASGAWAQGGGGGIPIPPEVASAVAASKARDKQLAADVLAAIESAGVDGSTLKVRAYHGKVTLHGTVARADQIEAASSAATAVNGVTAVKNKLHVRK
jgi:osmotically-inducible protein OsmY